MNSDDPHPRTPVPGEPLDRRGLASALAAYGLWGLLPVYWKLLLAVPPVEILFHRMVWSLAFLAVVLVARKRWAVVRQALREKKILSLYFAAAILLSCNWGLYIWAVNTGHILETSLGYFINPLMNVLLVANVYGGRSG